MTPKAGSGTMVAALLVSLIACAVPLCEAHAAQIDAGIAAGTPVTLRLVGGDVIRGTLVSESPETIVVRHPVLGDLTLQRLNVTAMAPTAAMVPQEPPFVKAETQDTVLDVDASSPEGVRDMAAKDAAKVQASGDAAAKGDASAPPADAAAQVDEPIPSKWKFSLAANANYVDSSDEQLDFRVAGSAVYEDPDVEKLKVDGEYFFRTVNSSTTDNNLLLTGVYDYFFQDSSWLAFGKVQGQMAPLEAWEQRLSGWGGVGYRFFREAPLVLTGKIGAGATREFGGINQTRAELYLELAGKWDISEFQSLEASCWIAPEFEDFSDYLLLSRLEWSVTIDPTLGMSFLGGLRYQYQSNVPAGDNPDDLRVYAGIKVDF
jgi:hypothetical protein